MKKIRLILLVLTAALFFGPQTAHAFQSGGDERNPFTFYYDEGPIAIKPGEQKSIEVIFQIPEGSYLYNDSIDIKKVEPTGISLIEVKKPKPVRRYDPFLKHEADIFYNEVTMTLIVRAGEKFSEDLVPDLKGELQFQGCSGDLCYRLMKVPFLVHFRVEGLGMTHNVDLKSAPQSEGILGQFGFSSDFESLRGKSLSVLILVFFVSGFLTSFTPCVWPMIPVTLTVIGVRQKQSVLKNLKVSLVLVLGMAFMYSSLGVGAAMLGKSLGFLFQSTFFLGLIIAVMLVMAFSLLGFYEISIPAKIQNRLASLSSEGLRGVFVVGLTMGLLAAPCVGPIVGPLLAFIAHTKSVYLGFVLLVSYAFGIGLLFILLSVLYGFVSIRWKSGAWLLWFKKVLGLLMLLVALFYANSLYHQLVSKNDQAKLDEQISLAQKASKPMVIDFYADWCPPCKELDKNVWSNPDVKDRLDQDFVFVKIDCTTNSDECEKAVNKFGVIGWPTVVFLDKTQSEVADQRLVGKVISSKAMLKILSGVENK